MMQVESISNRQLKRIRKLQRKKGRYKYDQFLLEGSRAVEQVLTNDILSVSLLCFDQEMELWKQEPWLRYAKNVEAVSVETADFLQVTDTDNPQGVMALVDMPDEVPVKELCQRNGVVLALDALQDPGNIGTIMRSATWFGSAGIIAGKGTVDLFHPKVVRSTAGTTGAIPYLTGELQNIIPKFKDTEWEILMLDVRDQAVNLAEVESKRPTVLIAGNEAHGVSREVENMADKSVQIMGSAPAKKHLESLNVAVSVGISLYHLHK